MINPQELADAAACPARDIDSPCQDAGYCYPALCPRYQKAVTLNQENQEEHDTDAQLAFVFA